MSTHRHVREALDKAVHAHRNGHRDALATANLEEHTEATISPVGAGIDTTLFPEGDNA